MTRILTGIIGVLVMIPVCIFSNTFIWPLVISLLSLLAVYEMLTCIGLFREKAYSIPTLIFSFLPLYSFFLVEKMGVIELFRCLFLFSVLYLVSVQFISILTGNRIHTEKVYGMVAVILYVVISLTAIAMIRYIDHGNEEGKYIYLLVFLGAWITDTFAYFTGRAFGKHKLCPAISPKKTVEGSIGGVLANMIGFAGYALVLQNGFGVQVNVWFFALLGILFSAVGQFGDLFASAIKRHFNVKDYGSLFPGHGGVMDRFDSTLAIALVMLMVYAAFGASFLFV